MRMCGKDQMIAMVLVFGLSVAMTGCSKAPTDPVTKGQDVKVAQDPRPARHAPSQDAAPKQPATNEPSGQEKIPSEPTVPDVAPKEPAGPDVAAKDTSAPEPAAKENPAPDFGVKVFTPPGFPTADKKDPKKKDKEPTKESPKDKEPKYDFKEPAEVSGKTFDQWLALIKKDKEDPVVREEAMKNIINFGPHKSLMALPEIVTQLEKHKKGPPGVDLAVRVNGVTAISTIYKMLPIIKKEPDPKLHERTFELYKGFLKDQQVIMRLRTVQGLPYLGFIARGAMDEVVGMSKDPITWEVRKEALQTLTMIAMDEKGVPSPKALLELRYRCQPANERSYTVRQTALQGLVLVGGGKVPPEVYKALKDPAVEVRYTALNLISSLSEGMAAAERQPAVKHLNDHLKDEKDSILIIWTHATSMTVVKNVNAAHMNPIVKYLDHKDPPVRVQALTVIGRGGKDSKQFALPKLLGEVQRWMGEKDKTLPDWPDPNVALATMMALVQIHAEVESTPTLEKLENDKKMPEFLRIAAGKALDAFADIKKMDEDKKKDKDKDKDKKAPDKK